MIRLPDYLDALYISKMLQISHEQAWNVLSKMKPSTTEQMYKAVNGVFRVFKNM